MAGFLCSTVCSAAPWLGVESIPPALPSRALVAGFKLWWNLPKYLSLKNKTNAQAPLPLSAPSSPGLLIWEGREREGEGFLATTETTMAYLWGEERTNLLEMSCMSIPFHACEWHGTCCCLTSWGWIIPPACSSTWGQKQWLWAEGRLLCQNSCIYRLHLRGLKVSHYTANYILSLSVSQGVRGGLTSHWGLKQ